MVYQSGTAQIPINGFCKYSSFSIKGNYKQIFSLNFNQDTYSDILLAGGDKNGYSEITGKGMDNFVQSLSSSFSSGISNFATYIEAYEKTQKYAFVSRKQKKAGWLNISSYGTISVESQIAFSSFPESITPVDLNDDGKNELVVSGVAFDGISLLKNNHGRIEEKKIAKGIPYSQSAAIDFNNDSYPDIAAFNLTNNALDFYYNNSRGSFRLTRSVTLPHPISSLQAFDFNSDYYPDLLFICGKTIEIIFGDSVAGYERTEIIQPNLKPDKFIWGDFNHDGKFDLAYLNIASGQISVLFQKSNGGFYPEIPYLQKEGLVDLAPFYSKFVYGFAALQGKTSAENKSPQGTIYFVTNLTAFGDASDLVFGNMPTQLSVFDFMNDGISDLCLYNVEKGICTFVLRGKDGIPSTLYSQKISGQYSSLLINDLEKTQKEFCFYSADGKVIEYLLLDFATFTVKKKFIYVDGGIKDCRFMKNPGGGRGKIVVIFNKDDQLFYSAYTYKDIRYTAANASLKTGKLLDAKINSDGDIYFWTKEKGEADLTFASFTNPIVRKTIHSVAYDSLFDYRNYLTDIYGIKEDFVVTALTSYKTSFLLLANKNFHKILHQPGVVKTLLATEPGDNYFGRTSADQSKKFVFYSRVNSDLFSAELNRKPLIFVLKKMSDLKNAGMFTINKFNANQWYALYTNTAENCVSLKKL